MKALLRTHGFTLVELLIGMAIVSIIFLLISSVSSNMATSSTIINTRSALTQDAQMANRLIAGRLAEAIYIYPPGRSMQLADSGATTYNAIRPANGWRWTVNSDPFVAMILPPRAPAYSPGSNMPNNCSPTVQDGCYRFFAYYATLRKYLTDKASAGELDPSSVPAADDRNPDSWVIMQYQRNIVGWFPSYTSPVQGVTLLPEESLIKGNSGDLLLDYVEPQIKSNANERDLFTGATGAAPGVDVNCDMFCVQVPSSGSTATANNGRVEVRFRMLQKVTGLSDIAISGVVPPGATRPYLGSVASPLNWWQ